MPRDAKQIPPAGECVLRKPEVLRRVGRSNTQLYRDIRSGRFPRPIRLGPQSVGWLASEIDAYIASLASERDGGEMA